MMDMSLYDSSESGYLADSFEGVGYTFTDVEILWQTGYNTLARAKRYGRWWMLKSIKPELDGQMVYRQMMRKELEMLMKLQHPFIVQVVGIEDVAALGLCIVMEYVDGVRLDEWLAMPRNKESRCRLAGELLDAVEYMHSMGIVHRDLKPSNVLVTRNGENVKLIDLGLADSDHQAILKQPAGTPRYISPEQAATNIPDVRNDIYSLGKILQDLLPERVFRGLVNGCLLPMERRFQNITLLVQAFRKLRRHKNHWVIGLSISLMIILSIGLGVQTWRIHKMDSERLKVVGAIELGMKKVEVALMQTEMEMHLDTLTNLAYLSEDFNARYMDGYHEANLYFDSIKPFFTHIEMSEIVNAVTLYCAERQKLWMDKIENLRLIIIEE